MGKINDKITLIVVHCSATPDEIAFAAKDMHRMHLERGFDGIGYHKVIKRDGTIEHGRPEYWIGSHAAPYNTGSLGICLIGTDKFEDKQFDSLETLLHELKAKYGAALKIVGHRDLSPDLNGNGQIEPTEWIKVCPGFDVATFIKERGI